MKELTLDEAYAYLVRTPNRAELVNAVDRLMESYRKDPSVFVMPNHYGHLVSLVEAYALNRPGWVEFVRELTEQFPKRGEDRMALQAVKRRIESAYEAEARRARQGAATEAAEKLYGPFDTESRRDYYFNVHAWWALRRKTALARARRVSGNLSHDEQTDIFNEHWAQIDAEIASNTLPHPDKLQELIADAAQTLKLLTQ